MVNIEFVLPDGTPTKDRVKGWPTVWVNINVGFVLSTNPNDPLPPMKRVRALIDTGDNHTVLDPRLAIGLTPIRKIPTQSYLGAGVGHVHNILM